MPAWMKRMERSMRKGGVDEPYALMNDMGIKRGSKTVVSSEAEAKQRASSYGKRQHRGRTGRDAGDAIAASMK